MAKAVWKNGLKNNRAWSPVHMHLWGKEKAWQMMRIINSDAYKPAVIHYLQCSIELPELGGCWESL